MPRENWAGYSDHRYGPRHNRKPKLASVAIQKAPPKANLIGGAKRTALVQRTADLLRDWKVNRWEAEAATRAGLRVSLIAMGNAWERSDEEAAGILRAAFNTLGRGVETRPKWDDGQKYATYGPDHCLWCFGPLDEDDIARNRRFCCPEHAKASLLYFDFEAAYTQSEIGNHAQYLVRLDKAEERVCHGCGRPFKSTKPDARFCSQKCQLDHNEQTLPQRLCKWCLTPFQPRHQSQMFCSEGHKNLSKEARKKKRRHQAMDEQPERECARDGCNETFRPRRVGRATDRYCSERCQRKAAHQREKERKARAPT